METLNTPEQFRPKRSHRNEYDHNYGVAEDFYYRVMEKNLDAPTDKIYVPIFWAACYHHQSEIKRDPVFRAVPELQEFLDRAIDPDKQYFTVARCDEGLYEDVPNNITIFGACGGANIPIPLTTEVPLQTTIKPLGQRRYKASFVGCLRPGGPMPIEGKITHSVYDPNGIGTQVRKRMHEVFNSETDCISESGRGGNWARYAEVLSDSVFALAPRGYGMTSFRLYEAMAFGCIPVYISDVFTIPYPELPWNQFCVFCQPEQLGKLPRRLEQLSELWKERAVSLVVDYYASYFTLEGTSNQIANALERL